VYNGERAIGYYLSEDKGLENNLIKNTTLEMELLNIRLNMVVQDYMSRIVNEGLK
jgi:hypothetical protein